MHIVLFLVAVAIRSTGVVPTSWLPHIQDVETVLLGMGLAQACSSRGSGDRGGGSGGDSSGGSGGQAGGSSGDGIGGPTFTGGGSPTASGGKGGSGATVPSGGASSTASGGSAIVRATTRPSRGNSRPGGPTPAEADSVLCPRAVEQLTCRAGSWATPIAGVSPVSLGIPWRESRSLGWTARRRAL